MSAVGFASMPVVPSLQGMRAVLEKQLQGPLSEASKKAGDTLSKGLTDGVEKASKDVARARKAEADAATAVAQAEDKVTDARGKAEVKAKSVEQAELALQAARLSSKGAVEKAEQSLAKLRESGTASTDELATAERKLEQVRAAESSKVLGKENALERARQGATKATKDAEKATTDLTGTQAKLADAQDNVTAASKRLENAQDGAEGSTSKLKKTFGDAEGAANGFDNANVKLAASMAAIVGAAAASVKSLYDLGSQFDDMFDTIRIGTGASGDAFAGLQDSAMKVAQSVPAMDGGLSQIGSTMADLNTRLGATGEPLETLTGQFVQLANMGIDADINDVSGALTQFNIDAAAAPTALDDLFRISQATGRSITDITSNLSKSGPALQEFGFGLNESAGLLGALDKAGLDSEKTVGSMTKALSVFAKEGKEPQTALWGTIQSIDELSAAGKSMEAIDLANSIFGAKGGAGFVAAVQSGKFEYDDFLHSLGASGDTILGVAGETADFAEQWQLFKQMLAIELAPVANRVFGAIGDSMTWFKENAIPALRDMAAMVQNNVIPAFQVMGQWVQDNRAWLEPLAVAVGGAAIALGGLALAQQAQAMWAARAAFSTTLLGKALLFVMANPIVAVIAALAAGLTYFFMKTETGQAIWSSFMDGLSAAGDWLSTTFAPIFAWIADVATSAWEGIKSGWDTLASAFSTGWEWIKSAFAAAWGFISPIFTALKIGFAIVLTAALLFWEGIKLYWGLVADLVVWAWNTVIKPVWDAMQIGLQVLGSFFGWVWTALIQPAWNALGAGIAWVWDTIIRPTWDLLKAGLGAVGSFFQWVWAAVIKPVWDALGAGIQWVWDAMVRPVWDGMKLGLDLLGQAFSWAWNSVIKPIWDGLGAGIRWVADAVIHPVFDGIQRGLDLVRNAFRVAVDVIGSVWDEIREKTAAPIRFVIDTVYNKGIVEVWNKVAGWLGMDDKKLEPMAMAFASGGVLPGYTPGRDVHKFVNPATGQGLHLSGGEAIMRPEWTRAVGGVSAVDRMNRDARMGRLPADERGALRSAHRHALGGVLTFAGGGVVGAMENIIGQKYPMLVPVYSGYRPSADNHGRGLAGDFSNGTANTPAMTALANDIATTYPNSMELIYESPGFDRQIKNGAYVGPGGGSYGFYAGAGNHANHVHWAMGVPPTMPFGGGVFEGGSDGSAGGGGMSVVGGLVRSAIDTIMNPIMDSIPEGGGLIGGLGRGLGDKVFGTFKDWILSKIPSGSGGGGGTPLDLSGVAGDNLAIGQAAADMVGWKGHEWDMLKELWTRESQWNNNAQNPTSTAYGIAQFLDATWAGFGPKTADPRKQIEYGVQYIQQRYGTPSAAVAFHDANNWYDQGGYLMPGASVTMNGTGKPEPVFTNPQWTLIKSLIISTAELLDPLRVLAKNGRDAFGHIEELAENSRRQLAAGFDAAGAAVWAALPGEVQDALTVAQAVGQQWQKVSGYLGEKAIAWSKGEWPIGSGRVVEQQAGPAWLAMHLDESLEKVARSNVELAEQVIAGTVSPGNDPVANALFDIFGRDPILPDLARIAALGPNAIGAATDAAMHAFETGETARLEEWTASNSQLTEAVLRARDAAIVTGEMVQGAVNGYLNWAMASDSQGRQGSWQEYFQHYGGEYGTAQGDWLLGQVGLGGILGGKLKDSAANVLIEAAKSPLLSAPAILDDDGRVIGSQLDRSPDLTEMDRSGYTELSPVTAGGELPAAPVSEAKSIVIEVQGTQVSVEELEKAVGALNGEVNGVKVEVKRMQNQTAEVTSGVSLMV